MDLEADRRRVWRLQHGDHEAARELVEAHWRAIPVAAAEVGWADAEDALQEAFLRAWRSPHQRRGEQGFAPWLARIVRNSARPP